jgi:hypothetical protein
MSTPGCQGCSAGPLATLAAMRRARQRTSTAPVELGGRRGYVGCMDGRIAASIFAWVAGVAACSATGGTSHVARRVEGPTTAAPAVARLGVRFAIDEAYDANMVFVMLHMPDPAGFDSRSHDMGIAPDAARAIRDASSFQDALPVLGPIVEARYQARGDALEKAKSELEADWASIAPRFSDVVVDRTGSSWLHDEYVATVSAFHKGISDWQGNHVAVGADLDRASRRRILAHEITLSEIFQLLRRKYDPQRISDGQAWMFSEMSAVFVLDDPRL